MNHLRTRQIGRLAEGQFETLCISSELTASPPKHDEYGWDYIVEFPPNRLANPFLDAQPTPIKFLCQVKATDNFSYEIPMKVSKLDHLSRATLPAFLFVVDFNG